MYVTKPKYLIIVIFLVAGLVGIMYVMKNVLHIPAYPSERHAKKGQNTPREKPETTSTDRSGDTVMFELTDQSVAVEEDNDASQPAEISDSDNPETYFQNLMVEYETNLAEKLEGKPNRTDIIVRYYPREADFDKVQVLNDLKLYIHKRETAEKMFEFPSNSLFYGDEVPTKDIQLIAYMLIQNGVPLKQIIPSKYHDDWKSRSVEIGADSSLTNELVLSLEEIKGFTNSFNSREW